MPLMPWTDVHDDLLRAAVPPTPEAAEDDLAALWARVAPTMVAGPYDLGERRPAGGRRLVVALAAVVAVGAAGVTGVAAADLVGARTGVGPTDAEDLRLGGPGERLDLAGSDLREVIAAETTDIPFPDDRTRRSSLDRQATGTTAEQGPGTELASVGAFRAWVAADAVCAWANQWSVATRSGDDRARSDAAARIEEAATWPAVTAVDPDPSSRWRTIDVPEQDGTTSRVRVRDDSPFAWLDPLVTGVGGRDVGAVAEQLADNGPCRADMVPDLPRADPSYGR